MNLRNEVVSKKEDVLSLFHKFELPTALTGGGGGGAFGPHHQTGSKNSRTLSPGVSKIYDFSFMLFGHIVAKFEVN